MGGAAQIDALSVELDAAKRNRDSSLNRRQTLLNGAGADPGTIAGEEHLTADYQAQIADLGRQISVERRRGLSLGIPIYVLLGGAFAAAVATNLVQALLIGFGWTAIANRFGLAKDQQQRTQIRQTEAQQVQATIDDLATRLRSVEPERRTLEKALAVLTARVTGALPGAAPPAAAPPGPGAPGPAAAPPAAAIGGDET